MGAVLVTAGTVLGAALGAAAVLRVWRWRCPSCGLRRLRYVGLASAWRGDGVESRFPEGLCGACGRSAAKRAGLLGRWEPD